MTNYIVVTTNTPEVRATMHQSVEDVELVAGQTTFLCWHLHEPTPDDLEKAQHLEGYLGIVEIK